MAPVKLSGMAGLTPAEAARLYPIPVSVNSVIRHMATGYGPQRIKLRSWKSGKRRVTSADAVEEFLQAINRDSEAQAGQTDVADVVAENGRAADKKLQAMGI